MHARLAARLLCLIVFAAVVSELPRAASAQVLRLEPDPQPRMPTAALRQRIAELSAQMDLLRQSMDAARDRDVILALRAGMFVRAAAVRALALGVGEPYAASSTTVVKGLTLADELNAIDAWLTVGLHGGPGKPDSKQRQTYVAVRAAVERMLEGESALRDATADELWRTHLSPLWAIGEAVDGPPVRNAWLDGDAPVSVDVLREMLAASALDDTQRQPWKQFLAAVERAQALSELRPRTEAVRSRMHQVLGLLVMLREMAWLRAEMRNRVVGVVDEAFARYREPSTRGEADEVLSRCATLGDQLRSLDALRKGGGNVAALATFAMTNFARATEPGMSAQVDAADMWLDCAIAALMRREAYRSLAGSREVREAMVQRDQQIDTSARRIAELALQIADDPRVVHHPSATSAAALLEQQVRDRMNLSLLGPRLAQISAFGTQPATAIGGRIRAAALDVSDGGSGASELNAFVTQAQRFAELPGEAQQWATPAWDRLFAGSADVWLRAVRVQRVAWAQRWAEGEPADRAGAGMDAMYRLTIYGQCAVQLSAPDSADRLNRWAAWQASAASLTLVTQPMTDDLRALLRRAADGGAARVSSDIDAFEQRHRVALAVGRWLGEVDPLLDVPPDGAAGAVASVLYAPDIHAPRVRMIEQATLLSWCLYEWQDAIAQRDEPRLDAIDRVIDAALQR